MRELKGISEKGFTNSVIELARWHKWRVFHALPAVNRRGKWASFTQGDVGFPDLVLVRKGGEIIFAELKTENGKTTPAQKDWLEALRGSPFIESYVWRPGDWEQIKAILK